MAGTIAVSLHDRLFKANWLTRDPDDDASYELTAFGLREMESLGLAVATMRASRRRFACACLDWSERRPQVGGAVGPALLKTATLRKWVAKDLDSRALRVTKLGERELLARFGVNVTTHKDRLAATS